MFLFCSHCRPSCQLGQAGSGFCLRGFKSVYLLENSFEAKCARVSPLTPSSERGIARCLERGMRRDGGPSK